MPLGEAFDKTTKLLGIDYPREPWLATLAEKSGAGQYKFSRPITLKSELDISFSGLKPLQLMLFEYSMAQIKRG